MLASSTHLRRLLLAKTCYTKVLVANIQLTHRYEPQQKVRQSLWKEFDNSAAKRERLIQLKALNMTCDEQIAMLKRSVEKGVAVSPRHVVKFVEQASRVSCDVLLEVMEIGNMLKFKDVDFYFIIMKLLHQLRFKITEAQVLRALEISRASQIRMGEFICSYILSLFRSVGSTDNVYKLASEGLEGGYVTVTNLPSVIYFLSHKGKHDLAVDLLVKALKKGFNLENPIYDVMKGAATEDVPTAVQLLDKLLENNITPGAPTLSAVVYQAFTTIQDNSRNILERLNDMMKTLNIKVDHLLWDIIDSFAQKNTPERIEPFLRLWFDVLGYKVPSLEKVEYHLVPYVRSKKESWKGECAAVLSVIGVLSKHYGLVLDSRIYLLLLSAQDRMQNLPAIVRLLMDMETNDCIKPEAHVIALEAAAKAKNTEVGSMLFQLAKNTHKQLIPAIYTAALKVAVQQETLDWARSVFTEFRKTRPFPNQSQLAYNIMISALMARDRLDDALELLNEMEISGKPTVDSYFKILVRLIELGNNSLANAKTRNALQRGISFKPEHRAAFEAAYDSRPTTSPLSSLPPSAQQTTSSSTDYNSGEGDESSPNFDNYYLEDYPHSDSDQYVIDTNEAQDANSQFHTKDSPPRNVNSSNAINSNTGDSEFRNLEFDPNVVDTPAPFVKTYQREGNQIETKTYPYPQTHIMRQYAMASRDEENHTSSTHHHHTPSSPSYEHSENFQSPSSSSSSSSSFQNYPPQNTQDTQMYPPPPPPSSFQSPPMQNFPPPPPQNFAPSPPSFSPPYSFAPPSPPPPPPAFYTLPPPPPLPLPPLQYSPPQTFHSLPPPSPPPLPHFPAPPPHFPTPPPPHFPTPTLPPPPPLPLPPLHSYQGNFPPQNYPPPQNYSAPPQNFQQNFPSQNFQQNFPPQNYSTQNFPQSFPQNFPQNNNNNNYAYPPNSYPPYGR